VSRNQAEEISADLKGDLYYVEAIVEHRSTPRGLEYLIKWLGYGYELNTWEPAAHLNCPHLIKVLLIPLPLLGPVLMCGDTPDLSVGVGVPRPQQSAASCQARAEEEDRGRALRHQR